MFHILVIICSVNLYITTLNKTRISSYQHFFPQLLFPIILLLKMSFDFSSSLYLHLLTWKMRKILFHNSWNCFQQQWGEVYMPVFLESVQVLAYAQRSHDPTLKWRSWSLDFTTYSVWVFLHITQCQWMCGLAINQGEDLCLPNRVVVTIAECSMCRCCSQVKSHAFPTGS